MKRRTPDAISKKRQQLYKIIVATESHIQSLSTSLYMTYEEKLENEAAIKKAKLYVDNLRKELHNTQKDGRPFNLDFRKDLHPGVF